MKHLKFAFPLLASAFVLAAPAAAADRPSRAYRGFLAETAQSGRAEVQAGKLAAGGAADADVKAMPRRWSRTTPR